MIYSDHKGAPLDDKDLDGNFRELVQRLELLEKSDFPSLGIISVETEGDKLIFKGPGQTVLGTAILPTVMPSFKGPWRPYTAYISQDWVRYKGELYACIKNHHSEEFNPDLWMSLESNPGDNNSKNNNSQENRKIDSHYSPKSMQSPHQLNTHQLNTPRLNPHQPEKDNNDEKQ